MPPAALISGWVTLASCLNPTQQGVPICKLLPVLVRSIRQRRKNASSRAINIAISVGTGIVIYGYVVGVALLLEAGLWSLVTQIPAAAITALYAPVLYYLLEEGS